MILQKKNILYIIRYLVISISIVLFIEGIKFFFKLEEPIHNKIEDNFYNNLFWNCLGVVLFSPLLEELAFRLSLKTNRYYLISVIASFIFLLSSKFILTQVICAFFIVIILINQFENKFLQPLVKSLLVIFSLLSFVLMHFDNYDKQELGVLSPFEAIFLFMPQLILGIILTKIRMETYFMNALIFHSIYNLIILTLALFFNY